MRHPVKFGTLVILQYNDPNGCCHPKDILDIDEPSASSEDPLDISNFQPTDSDSDLDSETSDPGSSQSEEAWSLESKVSSGMTVAARDRPDNAAPLITCAATSVTPLRAPPAPKNTSSTNSEQIVYHSNHNITHKRSSWVLCACKVCAKPCVSAHILRRHMRVHTAYPQPASPRSTDQCPVCLARFESVQALQYHGTFVHGIEERGDLQVDALPASMPMSPPAPPGAQLTSDIMRRVLSREVRTFKQSGPSNSSTSQLPARICVISSLKPDTIKIGRI